jgi:hypothetical protein
MTITVSGTAITFPDATTQTTAAGAASIPAGSVVLFYQSAAPTGWTQVTTQNNKALRVVSGTGGGTGGSVVFTTAFASQAVSGSVGTSGATTLSTSEIPSHTHTFSGGAFLDGNSFLSNNCSVSPTTFTSSATGGGGSHTHSGGTFTGTAINLAVQYIDIILASKN